MDFFCKRHKNLIDTRARLKLALSWSMKKAALLLYPMSSSWNSIIFSHGVPFSLGWGGVWYQGNRIDHFLTWILLIFRHWHLVEKFLSICQVVADPSLHDAVDGVVGLRRGKSAPFVEGILRPGEKRVWSLTQFFCWLFTIEDWCLKVCLQQTHNQGFHQLYLTVS